jgi:hypothetical protein
MCRADELRGSKMKNRICSIFLCIVLILGVLGGSQLTAVAASADVVVTDENGQTYPVSETGLTEFNHSYLETIHCTDIYYLTLPSDVDDITVDFNQYRAAGGYSQYFFVPLNIDSNIHEGDTFSFKFSELYNASQNYGWALTGDNAPISLSGVFGSNLPSELKETNQVIAFAGTDFNKIWDSSTFDVVLIIQKEVGTVDRSALDTAITNAETASNSGIYYTENDRYNGKETSKHGFWNGFQTALASAVAVNSISTQEVIDDAASGLTCAAVKLIAKANINATVLYEELQTSNALEEDDYTSATWPQFEAARTTAQAILTDLYDEDGNPTAYNSSTTGTAAADVAAAATALTAARENLFPASESSGYSSTVSTTTTKINTLKEIISRNPLNESEYTDESWAAYQAALAAANADAPVLTGTSADLTAVNNYKAAYTALYNAYYFSLQPVGGITVELTWNDRITSKAYKSNVALQGDAPKDFSLEAALEQESLDVSHVGDYEYVYINDVYVGNNLCIATNSLYGDVDLPALILHPGDQISVLWIPALLSTTNPNPAGTTAVLQQYEDSLKVSSFTQEDGISIEAGKPLSLEVTEVLSAFNADRDPTPAEGLTFYTSDTMGITNGACTVTAVTIDGETVTTDEDGSAEITFYEEGWYLVGSYDTRSDIKGDISNNDGTVTNGTYYSVKSGALVWVHVTASSDPEAIKADLKDELDEVYEEYPESYFRPENWTLLATAYTTAVSGITSAETIGEAYQAQQTGIVAIKKIQDDTTTKNTTNLETLLGYLSRLPDDKDLLTQSVEGLVNNCIDLYGSLSDYQLSRLTTVEIEKCEMLIEAAAEGLPEAKSYNLTYEINADTEEAVAAIEEMIQYLQENNTMKVWDQDSNTRSYDAWKNQGNDDSDAILQFNGNISAKNIYEIYPDSRVALNFDVGQYAYLLVREDSDHCITGDSGADWTISDDNFEFGEPDADSSDLSYTVITNMTVKIDGTEYELKSIDFEGIDDGDVTFKNAPSFIDRSDYRDKKYYGTAYNKDCVNIIFPDSELYFTMPYEDVKVIFNWGTVGSGDDIDDAKVAAKSDLKDKYDSFDTSKYSEEGKTALKTAWENGTAKINAATTLDGIASARKAALAAMMAVNKISDGNSGSSGEVDLPDYGKVIGSVKVSVRNDTFSGGDFKGELLDGWYDLCENDTMMTVILKALASEGYTWKGTGGSGDDYDYDISYLASIQKGDKKLAEFSGEAGSGWMGTINDWFTNEGFNMFGVQNGKLENGDVVEVQYTQNKGEDIGGTWYNSDTSLKTLSVTGGTLAPSFKGSKTEYTLLIDENKASITLTPTANNKNYLVKAFLNYYKRDSAFYKRTESISVKDGDIIYVGVGEKEWPSMNSQGDEAIGYKPTKYTIAVKKSNADSVIALITALPDAKRITIDNYTNYEGDVEAARAAYDSLSDKSNVTNLTKLTAVEDKLSFYTEIDKVKTLLEAIPTASKITLSDETAVVAADTAYKALSDDQKKYITVGDVTNYNAAIDRLIALGAFKTGSTPRKIPGSTEAPAEKGAVELTPTATITGSTAKAVVSNADAAAAIETLKEANESELLIEPVLEKAVNKLTVELPKSALQEIVDDTAAVVTIKSDAAELSFSQEALKTIAREAGTTVSVTAEKVDSSSLSAENKALVGDHPVFDFSVTVDKKAVTSFNGTITISIPYTPKTEENAGKLTVYYLDSNGNAVEMVGAHYDEDAGAIVFETDHFSSFAVVYDKNKMLFEDVKDGAWYYDAVNFAVDHNLFNGTSETMFSPDARMTRAMLVTVLYRMDQASTASAATGSAITGSAVTANSFSDVKPGQWYSEAVAWADACGITEGIGNGLFGTNNNVTREQLATILNHYAEYKGYDVTKTAEIAAFTDAGSISSWAQTAMRWANAEGLISGRTTDTLVPGGSASRAEVAIILQRFAEGIE